MANIILLTGATGFVGRQVYKALSRSNCRVRLVVREGKKELWQENRTESVVSTTDLFAETEDWWEAACKDVDIVVHVAWYVEHEDYLYSSQNLDCLTGTLRLAKGAARSGVRRFIGIGTCLEYDLTRGDLSINTPLAPLSPYAAAKAAAFLTLSQWLPQQGVEFTWGRLFYLYGEGDKSTRLVSYLRAKLEAGQVAELTSGKQVRDYLNVREAGEMIADVALSERTGAVNICSGIPITVRELAEHVADEYGRRDLLRFGARPDNPVDPVRVVGVR